MEAERGLQTEDVEHRPRKTKKREKKKFQSR